MRIDPDALARKAEAVIGVVLEQHIDPPTRQEMWLQGIRALLASAGVEPPGDLSGRISRLTEPDDFRELLVEVCSHELTGEPRAGAQGRPTTEKIIEAFFSALLDGDPPRGDVQLVSRSEKNAQEQIGANRYVGTGIALDYDEKSQVSIIANVVPEGPMERAGGHQNDRILRIDGENVRGLDLRAVTERLRGEEGTIVTLIVQGPARGDRPRTITVTRGPLKFPSISGLRGGRDYQVDPRLPIRYVKLNQINGSAVHELRKLDRWFAVTKVQAVILDFRSNRPTDVHQALLLADALLDGGQIGKVHSRSRTEEYRADRDCLFRNVPLAVLVDGQTNGPGEWVAAALQDNRAAVIVGEPTAGAGFVSSFAAVPGTSDFVRLPTGVFEPAERPPSRALPEGRDQGAAADLLRAFHPVLPDVGPDAAVLAEQIVPSVVRLLTGGFKARQPAVDPRPGHANDPILEAAVVALQQRIASGQGRIERCDFELLNQPARSENR